MVFSCSAKRPYIFMIPCLGCVVMEKKGTILFNACSNMGLQVRGCGRIDFVTAFVGMFPSGRAMN
jgi:hypothetical protein